MAIFELPPWDRTTIYQGVVDFCKRNGLEEEFRKAIGVKPKEFEDTEFMRAADAIQRVLEDIDGRLFTVREHDADFNLIVVDEYKFNTFSVGNEKLNTKDEVTIYLHGHYDGKKEGVKEGVEFLANKLVKIMDEMKNDDKHA